MFQKIISNDEAGASKAPHVPNQPQASAATSAPTPAQPEAAVAQPQAAAGHRNRLSSDVEIKGIIRFQDELIVDGKVEGEIHSTGSLTIQENARIRAEIHVGSVVVQGKVHGNIVATGTIELRTGSEVVGDIKAAVLTMEAGAIFVGRSEVGAPTSKPVAGKAAKSSSDAKSASSNAPQQQKQQVAKAS